MVKPAKRHGELVAYFKSHSALLSELKMVCIGRATTAGEAGLGAHELQMMPVAQPKWFAKWRDELPRSLRSCVGNEGCILVRRAALGNPVAVELASRFGLLACRTRFAVKAGVAVCDHRLAVAVGLGSRTPLRCIDTCSVVAELVELCGKSGLNLLGIRCGELVFERQNSLCPDRQSVGFCKGLELGDQFLAQSQ